MCVRVYIWEMLSKRVWSFPLNPSCYCLCCWTHLLWTASDRLLMATTFPITNSPPQSSHCCWYMSPPRTVLCLFRLWRTDIGLCCTVYTLFTCFYNATSPAGYILLLIFLRQLTLYAGIRNVSCLFPAPILFWGSSQLNHSADFIDITW
jgi:hypothetical protein